MKVVRLQVSNFLGLREVDIKAGMVNVVRGKNRQGKTSLIKAIEAAFLAGDQSAKIRQGQESAEILVELDDAYVQRSITRDGKTKLMVADKQGEQVKRPQEFLDGLLGGFSFNPAEFFLLDKKKQISYLLESFTLRVAKEEVLKWIETKEWPEDVSDEFLKAHALVLVDKLRKYFYTRRTEVNRQAEKLLASGREQAKSVPPGFDLADYDENGLKKLYAQVRSAEQNNARIATLNSDFDRLQLEVLDLERRLKMKKSERDSVIAERNIMTAVDVSEIEKQIAGFEVVKKQAEAATQLIDLRASYSGVLEESRYLDRVVDRLTNDVPRLLMDRVQLPVESMKITEEEVLFDGKPFDMLSGAEQVEVSLAIAKSLNGQFKVVCVDGVEKLDEEAFATFMKQMETDKETQFFVTKVGLGAGIEIENGTVKNGGKNGTATRVAA